MSVSAGAILLGSALIGAVGGSVGTAMVYEDFDLLKNNKADERAMIEAKEQQVRERQRRQTHAYEATSYYDYPAVSNENSVYRKFYYDKYGRVIYEDSNR